MRLKVFLPLFIIGMFVLGLFMSSPVYAAGDYVKLTKWTLMPEYKDQLKPVYEAWDKYAMTAKKMYPKAVAEIQAQIAITEAAAAEKDMPAFKKEMKKLKKAPKTLKKLAGKAKIYFAPYQMEMK